MRQTKPSFFNHPNDNKLLLRKSLWRTNSVPFFSYHLPIEEQLKINPGVEITFFNDLKPEIKNALLCK